MKLLSIIIPVYNEKKTIVDIIETVKKTDLPVGFSKEIVVVDDGSLDGSDILLQRYADDPLVRVFRQFPNAGKTAALRRGFKESQGDIILIQDADLEYHPSHYKALLEPILMGRADVVYGSRFLGTIEGMAAHNRFANVFSNHTFNLLFGVKLTDINTCFKVFPRMMIQSVTIESERFSFETEVTAKLIRKGAKIVEIPITYRARSIAEGKKIHILTALEMFSAILRYRFF
jgi:glycosyltransferase involved in cell wall biosynthesis